MSGRVSQVSGKSKVVVEVEDYIINMRVIIS
jgi:hypothetical protein